MKCKKEQKKMKCKKEQDIWRNNVKKDVTGREVCQQISNSPHLDRLNYDARFEMVSPTVYCVEPMLNNFKLLKEIGEKTNIDENSFKIMQYAVGNVDVSDGKDQFIRFPNAAAGWENMSMQKADKNSDKVRFISLDDLCKDMSQIDILSIDTEGNDHDVMYAGKQALIKTRYLEFEVHRDWNNTSWQRNTLYDVISYLDELKFDCFWSNNKGKLFQITNCWNSEYEKKAFTHSNFVCIKRNDIWHAIIKTIYEKQITAN